MTIEELKKIIDDCNIELRSLMESVKDTSKPFNADEVNAKKADIEARKAKAEKELAEASRPVEPKAKAGAEWRKLAEAMEKRTAVTINGSGAVLTVKELVKKIADKTDILNGARYFYGANASTVIPVWASNLGAAFVSEGGTVTPQSKSLGTTTVIPAQAISSLPVSQMTLDLSAANLEGELPDMFSTAFADLMAAGMLTGDASTNKMQGIFTDTGITAVSNAVSIENLAGFALTVMSKKFANPCIVMSPTVYNAFLADTTNTETVKVYKEDLIRNKSIEGVRVILSPYAPTAVTSSSVCAIGGDLSNYAIGVAGELKIKAKDTASSDVVTFDAYSYFNGKPVISSDFYGYTVA